SIFKEKEKIALVNLLYNHKSLKLSESKLCKLMMDTLYICLDYRNVAAHGGRTYNHKSNNTLRFAEIFSPDKNIAPHGFSELLFLLNLLSYKRPFKVLEKTLQDEISRHCNLYPQDVTYLGQILNINIIPKELVYISERSGKYHYTPHCSGINNAKEMDIEEAKKLGYILCKRCKNSK
ncbi:MAG: hypothetical protein K2J91_00120, partial [Lachnospiraceae bacterium]|nr:hypothetical protein [Lachnospiraceae bacterium]